MHRWTIKGGRLLRVGRRLAPLEVRKRVFSIQLEVASQASDFDANRRRWHTRSLSADADHSLGHLFRTSNMGFPHTIWGLAARESRVAVVSCPYCLVGLISPCSHRRPTTSTDGPTGRLGLGVPWFVSSARCADSEHQKTSKRTSWASSAREHSQIDHMLARWV